MKKTEAKELAKAVTWSWLDALEYNARDSWVIDDRSEEEKDEVEKLVFEMIELLKRKCRPKKAS